MKVSEAARTMGKSPRQIRSYIKPGLSGIRLRATRNFWDWEIERKDLDEFRKLMLKAIM